MTPVLFCPASDKPRLTRLAATDGAFLFFRWRFWP